MRGASLGTRPQNNTLTLAKRRYNPDGPLPKAGRGPQPTTTQGPVRESVLPRWLMSPMVWMLIVWGVLTAVLIVLLIYRSTLTMQEDDQLFLGDSESHMEQEQIQLMHKVNKINPFVRWLGAASGLLILVIAGLAIYQGLNQVQ